MSITGRQNNIFLAEDWKKVYQTFKNADFASYDFENLRRVMISYLRQNYPEDFNDYIESSEYLALIDLIAFLGQSLAFRSDLNARENFLELAERRESVIRLAQLLSYNPKRNICASGLLKVESVSTTENVIDSTGKNIANVEVTWNDVTNTNWFDQFTKIMNAAMISGLEFGYPETYDSINNIYTEQYRLNSSINDLTLFPFTKPIDGQPFSFEVVSTMIKNNLLQEEPPLVGRQVALVYRDDLKGYGSINTGWFMHFRQGLMQKLNFVIDSPVTNQIVNVNDTNINDSDIWLYSVNRNSVETDLWTKVPSITGNNIIYNSIDKTIKNIYTAQTQPNDSVNLVFADGIFGNLPKGSFRCYYRTSSGTTFVIQPKDMRGILVTVPYVSGAGTKEEIRFVLSLKSSVTSASAAETNTEIKQRAPATYYTQNRMITGEDYNLAPLSVSQNIAKVKTINRTSSGISRNFDLIDATGKYSSTNAFCTDGIIYREELVNKLNFVFSTKSEIESIIKNQIEPLTKLAFMRDFYYEKYNKILLTDLNPVFKQATSSYNESTGYLADPIDSIPLKTGVYTGSSLRYFEPGSLIKIVPPQGYHFAANNSLTTVSNSTTKDSIWVYVVSVIGDGTSSGQGNLTTGLGPIVISQSVPTGSIIQQIIPKFLGYLSSDIQSLMIELIFNYKNFGLRYDVTTRSWQIIQDRNLNLLSNWSLGKVGDNSGKKLDSSWLIAFETDGEKYTVTYRGLEYYFESILQNRFFYDGTRKIYDITTGLLQKDKVSVLKFNTLPNTSSSLIRDYDWEIVGTRVEDDGYTSSKVVKITFYDSNDDGIVDNPEAFDIIVDPSSSNANRFVFFEKYVTDNFTEDYRYVANNNGKFVIFSTEADIGNLLSYSDGQLFYFYSEDTVKILDKTAGVLNTTKDYYANIGRNALSFYYLHNADSTMRIDPSSSNIIDVYLLTKDYDNQYRKWLKGDSSTEPLPPSSTDLRLNYGANLDKIKSISDDLVYHSVKYKVLFGKQADMQLRATFKVVKNLEQVITDNDIKTRIIRAIDEFFSIDNFDFGDTFYFSELSAYVMSKLTPYITTFVIVPTNNSQVYGSLQQITSSPNEIFVSGARVEDVEIIQALTAARLKASGYIVTTSNFDVNNTNIISG